VAKNKHEVNIILKARDQASKDFKRVAASFKKLRIGIAGAAIKKAFSVLTGLITRMINLLKNMAKIATVAFGVISVFVIRMGANFQKQMSRVLALTGATQRAFAALNQEARRLGESTQFTATQASLAMSELALAGFSAVEIIESMPAVLNLAAAGLLEMADAADIATGIMFGMGVPAGELQRSVDVLSKAFTSSRTSLIDLGEGMKTLGPIARTAGLSLENTIAAMATLAQAGFRGERAGVGLRNVLIRLSDASGETKAAMDRLVSSTQAADGSLRPLADIVDEMNARFGDTAQVDRLGKLINAFGVRAGPIMASLLVKGGDELRRYNKMMEEAGGTAAEIAATQLDNLWGSFIKLKSVIQEVGLVVFDFGKKELRDLVDRLRLFIIENKAAFKLWGEKVKLVITLVKGVMLDFVSFISSDFNEGLKLMRELFIASLKTMIRVSIAIAATGGQAIFAGLKLAVTGSIASKKELNELAERAFIGITGRRPERGSSILGIGNEQAEADRELFNELRESFRVTAENNAINRLAADAMVRLNKVVAQTKDEFKEVLPPDLLKSVNDRMAEYNIALAALTKNTDEANKGFEGLSDKTDGFTDLAGLFGDALGGATSALKQRLGFEETRFLTFPGQTQFDSIKTNTKKTADNTGKFNANFQKFVDKFTFGIQNSIQLSPISIPR
jgi:TP901 family phage tail tape measure protein